MSHITLPALPYGYDDLAPHISKETLEFHHDKHHKAYVDKLNELIAGTELEGKALDEIIKATAQDASKAGIFNQAAQVWNHTFYWNCMKQNGGGQPTGAVAEKINAAFGSYEKFAAEFKNACLTQFGSGWGWLVAGRCRGRGSRWGADCVTVAPATAGRQGRGCCQHERTAQRAPNHLLQNTLRHGLTSLHALVKKCSQRNCSTAHSALTIPRSRGWSPWATTSTVPARP